MEHFYQVHERNDQLTFRFLAFVQREVRLRPHVLLDLLALVEKLRSALEFFVLDETMHEVGARVVLILGAGQRIGREQHFRFDIDERRGHVNKIGRDVHIKLFELVDVFEILRRDLRDRNVVNVDFLLLDQIEQEIERAIVRIQMNFVG